MGSKRDGRACKRIILTIEPGRGEAPAQHHKCANCNEWNELVWVEGEPVAKLLRRVTVNVIGRVDIASLG